MPKATGNQARVQGNSGKRITGKGDECCAPLTSQHLGAAGLLPGKPPSRHDRLVFRIKSWEAANAVAGKGLVMETVQLSLLPSLQALARASLLVDLGMYVCAAYYWRRGWRA